MASQDQHYVTKHANVRVPQPGITREEVDLVWAQGRRECAANGCTLRLLTRRQRKDLRDRGIGVQLGLNIGLIVGRHGEVVTAYHLSSDSFNPGVAGITVPVEYLDLHFVVNRLSVFRRDYTGLPFDPAAWSVVFYGDTSAAQAIRMVTELDILADANSLSLSSSNTDERTWQHPTTANFLQMAHATTADAEKRAAP